MASAGHDDHEARSESGQHGRPTQTGERGAAGEAESARHLPVVASVVGASHIAFRR